VNPLVSKWLAIGAGALLLGGVWKVQDWRYGQQLERQARLQADTLTEQALASAALQRTEQGKRLQLEQRLSTQDAAHYRELANAQTAQSRLRDRLATADLRLSVLLKTNPAAGNAVPIAAAPGGLVHANPRAELDPAHAQRIIAITGDGDRGLIALAACQDYVRDVSKPQ